MATYSTPPHSHGLVVRRSNSERVDWQDSGIKRSDDGEDDWRLSGRCRTSYGEKTDLFFGDDSGPDARKEQGRRGRIKIAKAHCNECIVRPECLQFALDNNEKYGIWGGMTERERRKLRKAMGNGHDDEAA